jgi:Leucine-rich repeat (LRR) protein
VVENALDIRTIIYNILHIKNLHLKNVGDGTIYALKNTMLENKSIKSLIIENPSYNAAKAMTTESVIDTDPFSIEYAKSHGYFGSIYRQREGFFVSLMEDRLESLTLKKNVNNGQNVDYKMTDLTEVLSSISSLKNLVIEGYSVKINKIEVVSSHRYGGELYDSEKYGDLTFLVEILNERQCKNLKTVTFTRNPIEGMTAEKIVEFNSQLDPLRAKGELDGGVIIENGVLMLHMKWTKK